MPSGN
ncbi:hypothetical protein F383_17058 [Gossypium arboreum]